VWWHILVIPAFRFQEEGHELEASLGYIVSSWLAWPHSKTLSGKKERERARESEKKERRGGREEERKRKRKKGRYIQAMVHYIAA
jgi:hypothetical protein